MVWTTKVDGYTVPVFVAKNYYAIRDMRLRRGDVILSTFPKSGTHWLSYIVWRINHPNEPNPEGMRVKTEIPYIDLEGPESLDIHPEDGERIFFTHFSSDRLPNSPCAKYVVMVRNPFDCCVSFYHFSKDTVGLDVPEDSDQEPGVSKLYFEEFMNGDLAYGCFFDHAKKWYNRRNEPNVHFMVYEQLKANPKEEILKLATFLGHGDVLIDNDGKILDEIVEETSFDSMKKTVRYENPLDEGAELKVFRKGQIGSFRASLSEDKVQKLGGKMEAELQGTELLELWRHL